jgi:hypothetical protein
VGTILVNSFPLAGEPACRYDREWVPEGFR